MPPLRGFGTLEAELENSLSRLARFRFSPFFFPLPPEFSRRDFERLPPSGNHNLNGIENGVDSGVNAFRATPAEEIVE